ncbi:hypothetical protein SDC9_92584 [bioreactor metagenome]|uniref:Uncharacterized protein n=1 Tax=bioreactor metagenome TaxID=1076179 RepID=A0A644ZYJ1_9ZZZZ
MERGGPDVVCHRAQTGRQTVLQLARSLVGEGDGDDLPGPWNVHGAQPYGTPPVLRLRVVRKAFQEPEVLLRGVLRHLVGVAAPTVGQKVVHPLNENGCLAGPGSRQQQEGALGGHSRLPLHGVQPLKVPRDDGFPGGEIALVEVSHMFTSFL